MGRQFGVCHAAETGPLPLQEPARSGQRGGAVLSYPRLVTGELRWSGAGRDSGHSGLGFKERQ